MSKWGAKEKLSQVTFDSRLLYVFKVCFLFFFFCVIFITNESAFFNLRNLRWWMQCSHRCMKICFWTLSTSGHISDFNLCFFPLYHTMVQIVLSNNYVSAFVCVFVGPWEKESSYSETGLSEEITLQRAGGRQYLQHGPTWHTQRSTLQYKKDLCKNSTLVEY